MLKRFFLSEQNIMWAILVNAFIIFLLYFPAYKGNDLLVALDYAFILFFVVEAAVKLHVLRPKNYFANRWNQFDFFIVVASIPSLSMSFLPIPDTSLLLLLRLFRLIRLIRFITFIPHLGKIIEGLGRAIRSAVFVLLALFFLNFVLAIFTCHFYGSTAPQYFGNPLTAFYSIFQLFTLEGWNEIPVALSQNIDDPILIGITRFYFALVVLFGGIFGMSLANAVFVDEMTIDNNQLVEDKLDKLQAEIAELKQLLQQRQS